MTQVKFKSVLSKDSVITDVEVSTKNDTFSDCLITKCNNTHVGNEMYYVALREILEYCIKHEYTNLMLMFPVNRVRDVITCKFGYSDLTDVEKEEFRVIHSLIDQLRVIAHRQNRRTYVDWMKFEK